MTTETTNKKNLAAITSDQWHVVHAHTRTAVMDRRRFERTIVSEHASQKLAEASATAFRAKVKTEPAEAAGKSAVFVRRPHYKTLKFSKKLTPAG